MTGESESRVATWLPEGSEVSFKPLAGSGEAFEGIVEEDGKVRFRLPSDNTFSLYEYEIK